MLEELFQKLRLATNVFYSSWFLFRFLESFPVMRPLALSLKMVRFKFLFLLDHFFFTAGPDFCRCQFLLLDPCTCKNDKCKPPSCWFGILGRYSQSKLDIVAILIPIRLVLSGTIEGRTLRLYVLWHSEKYKFCKDSADRRNRSPVSLHVFTIALGTFFNFCARKLIYCTSGVLVQNNCLKSINLS